MPFELGVHDIKCMKAEHGLQEWIRKRNSFTQPFLKEPVMTFCVSLLELWLTLATAEITEIQAYFHITQQLARGAMNLEAFPGAQSAVAQDPWWDLCARLGVSALLFSASSFQCLPFYIPHCAGGYL